MIYENVEKVRLSKGVTKSHLAKKLGMSAMGYHHISTGATKLDVDRLRTIAETLGVGPNIFFDDKLTENVINEQKQIS